MDISITLTGYVGGDVELRTPRNDLVVATFRVGTTPRLRRDNVWNDGPTTWTTVTCFRTLAENAAASLVKGDAVIVHGRLRTQAWIDAGKESHERLVLEATSIGHDLSRGTTTLVRSPRRQADESPATPTEEDELEPTG
jgi:single-strand DNA-binding protein